MKKVLALVLFAAALTACDKSETTAVSEDFKIGFIFLHDENSTYDKDFLEAAEAATAECSAGNEQVC